MAGRILLSSNSSREGKHPFSEQCVSGEGEGAVLSSRHHCLLSQPREICSLLSPSQPSTYIVPSLFQFIALRLLLVFFFFSHFSCKTVAMFFLLFASYKPLFHERFCGHMYSLVLLFFTTFTSLWDEKQVRNFNDGEKKNEQERKRIYYNVSTAHVMKKLKALLTLNEGMLGNVKKACLPAQNANLPTHPVF